MNLNLGSRLSCFHSDVRSTVDSVTAPIIISIKTHYKLKKKHQTECIVHFESLTTHSKILTSHSKISVDISIFHYTQFKILTT